jgi:microcystin-dependent protein
VQQIPVHNHAYLATGNAGTQISPAGNAVSASPTIDFYINDSPTSPMSPAAVSGTGGSQPHTNFQPYLCINFIISLFGIFPPPS